MSTLSARPFPIVLAAPSGTGKTTIAHALVDGWPEFVFSVSATTRPRRENEAEGEHYRFVSEDEFRAMVDRDEMVEWAEVHGHLYGTPRSNLEEAANRGEHVVLDIDVQGARQIRERAPEAVLIFIFPPSADALLVRLRNRGTERDAQVRRRLEVGRAELEEAREFDYVVVNDSLDGAVEEVRCIVHSERHRPSRARRVDDDVERLRNDMERILRDAFGASDPEET